MTTVDTLSTCQAVAEPTLQTTVRPHHGIEVPDDLMDHAGTVMLKTDIVVVLGDESACRS